MKQRPIQSWGRLSHGLHTVQSLRDLEQAHTLVASTPSPGLAHGNGRSYGDVCLNEGGTLWLTRGLDRFIAFDAEAGTLECEAGVTLQEIVEWGLPRGWFLPVTPGTQHVTAGGAVANDVHGKNHHRAGSFGHHVEALSLLRTDGQVIDCSARDHAPWFTATVGGLGLTGLITRVRVRLRKVQGPWIDTETHPFESLEEFYSLSARLGAEWEYCVAWIDCLHAGANDCRGLLFVGNHSQACDAPVPRTGTRRLPMTPPFSLVHGASVRCFNTLYYQFHRRRRSASRRHHEAFFYPLDRLVGWNRLYGPRGFYQYQCVVPRHCELEAVRELLRLIAASGEGSFLAVLKTFGERPSPGLLGFAMPGTTLALDFCNRGPATLQLFERLDEVVAAAGGRLYCAKDSRMPRKLFEAGYPRLAEFGAFRDPGISSELSRRLMGA